MLSAGGVRKGVWRRGLVCAKLGLVNAEPVIDREEVVALLFRVNDIAEELLTIRELLEAAGEEDEE